jgi:hypothetical protein
MYANRDVHLHRVLNRRLGGKCSHHIRAQSLRDTNVRSQVQHGNSKPDNGEGPEESRRVSTAEIPHDLSEMVIFIDMAEEYGATA